jgi:hypothetical protein
MSVDNGDMPAMPVECQFGPDEKVRGQQTGTFSGWEIGLSKRELFAAMAMQGYLSGRPANPQSLMEPAIVAVGCVAYADALLAELTKKAGAP